MDKVKVEIIERMPLPKNVKRIRNFLRHIGFYKLFIKYIYKIAKPLYDLLCTDTSFQFDDKCLIAFDRLKKELTSTPIITSLDWSLQFELMCDVSDYAVRAVVCYLLHEQIVK